MLFQIVEYSGKQDLVELRATVEFAAVNALFKSGDRRAASEIRSILENYTFLPEKILKIDKIGDEHVDVTLVSHKDHAFFTRSEHFAFLLAQLIKKLSMDDFHIQFKSQTFSEIYTLEQSLIAQVLTKFYIFSLQKFDLSTSPELSTQEPARAWKANRPHFNRFYKEILHHLKTNKFPLEDKPRHYSVLMNIEVAYRLFERC